MNSPFQQRQLTGIQKKKINEEINGWTALDLALTLKQQREIDKSPMSNAEITTNNDKKFVCRTLITTVIIHM